MAYSRLIAHSDQWKKDKAKKKGLSIYGQAQQNRMENQNLDYDEMNALYIEDTFKDNWALAID